MEEFQIVGKGRSLKVRKASPGSWTKRKRAIFFKHLAATCNVKEAAKAAGMGLSGAYLRYHAEPAFAAAWDAALAQGQRHLSALLMARSMGTARKGAASQLQGEDEDEEVPLPDPEEMDTELAMKVLALHSRQVTGPRMPSQTRMASKDELIAALKKAIATLERREARRGQQG